MEQMWSSNVGQPFRAAAGLPPGIKNNPARKGGVFNSEEPASVVAHAPSVLRRDSSRRLFSLPHFPYNQEIP
jgi:hypothetical protein